MCPSIQDALAAHASDQGAHRFAVADGGIVWPSGKVSAGLAVLDEGQGTLARVRQLGELREATVKAAELTAEAAREAERTQEALSDAQLESLRVSERLAELKGSVQSARSLADQARGALASATRELEDASRARNEAEDLIAKAAPDAERADAQLATLAQELAHIKEEEAKATARLAPLDELAQSLTKELQTVRLEAAKAEERKVYDEMMVQRHETDLASARHSLGQARANLHVKQVSASRLSEVAAVLEVIETAARTLVDQVEAEAESAEGATSGLHAASEGLRKRSREAQDRLDAAQENLSQARIEKARLEMQVHAAVQEIVEGCAIPLEQALELDELEGRPALEEEAASLERRIANLGTINPDAAQEYDELKQRYDYLASQLGDLTSAARSLTKIDRMIESRMKDDFVTTFEQINTHFQEVFGMLFPGGAAHLALTDPDDLENTGVEVNAQPAGKRIAKMSLMSGGEKSLTALALLFALYRTRPTPFYILDEVEAALDDTNLRRLTGFIDAMRDSTQLIMITHQRRTMEMADVLFGVSMGSDGVTKVVSQKLEHALKSAQ